MGGNLRKYYIILVLKTWLWCWRWLQGNSRNPLTGARQRYASGRSSQNKYNSSSEYIGNGNKCHEELYTTEIALTLTAVWFSQELSL